MIILLGTHPQYGHSPPTRADSMPTTPRPASARRPATNSPPTPSPTTITSASAATTASHASSTGCVDVFASAAATFLPPAHQSVSWPEVRPEPTRPCRRSQSRLTQGTRLSQEPLTLGGMYPAACAAAASVRGRSPLDEESREWLQCLAVLAERERALARLYQLLFPAPGVLPGAGMRPRRARWLAGAACRELAVR